MATYVRAKGLMFSLKFAHEGLDAVETVIYRMMSESHILKVDLGAMGCELINFGALSHVQVSSISGEDSPKPEGATSRIVAVLDATLLPDGGLALVRGIEDYLKGQAGGQE